MFAEDGIRESQYDLSNGASAPRGFNSTACFAGTQIEVGSWIITKPNLIPTCILAAIIGIYCGHKIKKTNAPSSSPYSISFFMFACMMTDAMIWNCFLDGYRNWSLFAEITGIIDGGLTSCVGMSFGFNALFDMGLLKESRKSAVIMSVSYLSMIGAWVYATVYTQSWGATFLYLYGAVILFCCGLYSIVTLVHVIRSRGVGLKYLLVGVISGGVGLASIFYAPLSNFWCQHFGLYFNGEWVWFILSDVAMFYLYKYYVASHVTTPAQDYEYYGDSDGEASDDSADEGSDEEVQVRIQLVPRPAVQRQQPHAPQAQQQPMYYMPVQYYSNPAAYYPQPQVTHVYMN